MCKGSEPRLAFEGYGLSRQKEVNHGIQTICHMEERKVGDFIFKGI